MTHRKDQVQDFLKDEAFVGWVLRPDTSSDAYWKDWLDHHPEKTKMARLARETILSFQYQDQHQLPTDVHARMLGNLISHQRQVHQRSHAKRQWYLPVAASLLLLLVCGVLFWHLNRHQPPAEQPPMALTVKQTQKGEKLAIQLPDGSQVRLNSNSVLVYPKEFDQKSRPIQLQGEAFFQVAKDPDRPFVITSGNVQTTVLGTTFNVRAFDHEQDVQVALVEGSVQMKGSHADEVLLSPNQVGYYHKEDSLLQSKSLDVQDLVAWSRDILIFENDSEEEVWNKLEDWYGITIIVQRKQSIEGKYSGRYDNEALNRVLEGISYAAEFDYEILENNTVIIK